MAITHVAGIREIGEEEDSVDGNVNNISCPVSSFYVLHAITS